MEDRVVLLDGARVIYIPQAFCSVYDPDQWHVKPEDRKVLEAGPSHEHYWDAWDDVLSYAYFNGEDGHRWYLTQDDDLFAIREE